MHENIGGPYGSFCFLACSNFRLLFSRCVSSSRPPEPQRFFVTDFLTQERWELDNVSLVLFFFYFASLSANVLLLSSSYLGMGLLLNYSNTYTYNQLKPPIRHCSGDKKT